LIPVIPQSSNNTGYYWDFDIEGQLLEGINVYLGLGKIIFDVVPKALGIYELKIILDVEFIGGFDICDFNGTSKDYILEIK
jgi:hypothetical protein